MTVFSRSLTLFLWLSIAVACTGPSSTDSSVAIRPGNAPKLGEQADQPQNSETAVRACSVTEPVWVKPPEDDAVQDSPEFGYYFVNEDRSMWASAWWVGQEDYQVRTGEEGIKVGWFRPAGARLKITGQRLDGAAPPLEAHVPCCYPTRFQATGLIFPTEGCWAITAQAAESELAFVVWVES